MRTIRLVALLWIFVAAGGSVRAQVVLKSGESYTHQFTSLPILYNWPGGRSDAWIQFIDVNRPAGATWRLEVFADMAIGSASCTYTNPPSEVFCNGAYWSDLRGALRFTCLSGSVEVRSFTINAFQPTSQPSIQTWYQDRIVPQPARLGIRALSATQVLVSWPTNATSYALERATTLSTPSWEGVTNDVAITGTNYSVTIDAAGTQRFFRLRRD